MERLSKLERGTLLAAALGLCALLRPAARQEAGASAALAAGEPPVALAEPRSAELVGCEEIWEHPGRFLARELALRIQFRTWIESWNPFLTRFGSGQYRPFEAWSEAQFPWRAEDHDRPLARFFVRRGSAADWALEAARRYESFELQVAVRSAFADEPWVEVLGVRPLVRSITEGSVLHASRALELMEDRAWQLAADELGRALDAPLPENARAELETLSARCREATEEIQSRPLLLGRPR